jgi:hypothetical protein
MYNALQRSFSSTYGQMLFWRVLPAQDLVGGETSGTPRYKPLTAGDSRSLFTDE